MSRWTGCPNRYRWRVRDVLTAAPVVSVQAERRMPGPPKQRGEIEPPQVHNGPTEVTLSLCLHMFGEIEPGEDCRSVDAVIVLTTAMVRHPSIMRAQPFKLLSHDPPFWTVIETGGDHDHDAIAAQSEDEALADHREAVEGMWLRLTGGPWT